MLEWREIYNSGFEITTKKPSKIVERGLKKINPKSNILDLGCGNGRNSIYCASLGHKVDAVDLVNLGFLKDTPKKLRELINFYESDVNEFQIPNEKYDALIMTRLLQYISPDFIENFLSKCGIGLKRRGIILINYTASREKPKQEEFRSKEFYYNIDYIKRLLEENKLEIIELREGEKVSTNVPYSMSIETYEIIAKK